MAGDLLPYLGELQGFVREAARVLQPGGRLAATVESHDGAADYVLAPTQRYRHAPGYLRRLLAEAGLSCLRLEPASVRCEAGQPVPGMLLLSEKCGSGTIVAEDIDGMSPPRAA